MTFESPTRIIAWWTRPSGSRMQSTSEAPNAAFRKSIIRSAPSTIRYGVTVWNPSGGNVAAIGASSDSARPLNGPARDPPGRSPPREGRPADRGEHVRSDECLLDKTSTLDTLFTLGDSSTWTG